MADEQALVAAGIAARAFAGDDVAGPLAPLGAGLIHQTFAAPLSGGRGELVIQRINTEIFRDPEALMQNLLRITRHLRDRAAQAGVENAERRVLRVVETPAGNPLFRDAQGGAWRAFPRIASGVGLGAARNPEHLRDAARAFGAYARDLSDLPGPPLHETLPHFHDFAARRRAFDEAVARDRCGRLASARDDVDAVARMLEALERALPGAEVAGLPRRVAHHDCKLDNLLFDARTGAALCVLDLDTTMPGSWLSDFGELARSASAGPADESQAEGVRFDAAAFAALASGYVGAVGDLLTEAERRCLPLAGAHMAAMNALRFATDHLEGDVYFRLFRPGQNLERARAQRALAEQMLAAQDALRAHVEAAARAS